jgi:hypothetical protein
VNALLNWHIEVSTMANNWLDWYTEPTPGKVKYLICQPIFVRKPIRMFSHLGYKGLSCNRDKGVSLYQRITIVIRRLFNECGGSVSKYPTGVGPNLLDSCGTLCIGELHLFWQSTSQSIDLGLSGGLVKVEIQGSLIRPGEANQDTRNSMNMVLQSSWPDNH